MAYKKRQYFVKISFSYQQQGGLYSEFDIPLDFKYLKDCEVFEKMITDALHFAEAQTDHWLEFGVEIEEFKHKKEVKKTKK